MEEKMFCKYCGEQIDTDSKVCPKCGKLLTEEAVPVEIQVPEQPKWLTWLTWIALVFCPPLGILLLWFANQHLKPAKKIILTIIFMVWAGIYYSDSDSADKANKVSKNNAVKVTLADFSTMSGEQAESWCETNKLNCNVRSEYSDTVAKGALVRQSSASGASIAEGSIVNIIYSLGKEPSMEFKNALNKAESYSTIMHMSKRAIYDQLVSPHGEGFQKDAAQYAVDNLKADYKANALAKAKDYSEAMSMSKNAIFDQLISEYGEKFTRAEAQYAVDNLYK